MNARLIAVLTGCVLLLGLVVTVVRSSKPERDRGTAPEPATTGTPGPSTGPAIGEAESGGGPAVDQPAVATVIGTFKGPEATVSPLASGTILYIAGPAGVEVRKGQMVVELDAQTQRLQADQAQKGAEAARQKWEQAKAGRALKAHQIEEDAKAAEAGVRAAQALLDKAETGAAAQVDQAANDAARAKAGVRAAQAQLDKAKAGARKEDRDKAEAGLRTAIRARDTAEKSLNELRDLAARGAVPRVRVDEAQARYDQAQGGVEQAEASLAQVKAGAAPEDIAAAEAGVEEAKAGLKAAEDAVRQKKELSAKDVDAARIQLENAQRGLALAKQANRQLVLMDADIRAANLAWSQARDAAQLAANQVRNTRLTSPLDGVVSTVMANRGDVAGPGRPLLSIAGTNGLWLEVSVPSRLLSEFRAGQAVIVEVDALRAKWRGKIREVSRAANPDGRSFMARIDLTDPAARGMRPGMRARAYPAGTPRPAAGATSSGL